MFFTQLKRIGSFIVSSKRDLLILFTSLFNKDTPKMIKTMTIAAFVYLISPIDFIPDVIPGIGLLDDAVIVPGLLYAMLSMLPQSVRIASEQRADFLAPKMPFILGGIAILFIAWTIFVLSAIYNFIFN